MRFICFDELGVARKQAYIKVLEFDRGSYDHQLDEHQITTRLRLDTVFFLSYLSNGIV